ncbi:MAG: hypothetical protein ABR584_02065 [Candidatus Baltobacteraceae bacterium]
MSAFNILGAISTGIKAFETTGNPYVALGAAAIGGFSTSSSAAVAESAPGGGEVIGSLVNGAGGSGPHNALKSLADQKPVDYAGLIS